MRALGLDTSNYTTSAAVFDGASGKNMGRLLDVPAGSLGLRQSDALFQHVKHLPGQIAGLKDGALLDGIAAVGASTRPRAVEGSYMPCFLAGEGQGRALADCLGVPFFAVSHQQGHLAAAAFFSGHPELMDAPFLAWHLSGGTTELLYVKPAGKNLSADCIGGTEDISAGQLIDRTGKLLGLDFPAGKALDGLCATHDKENYFTVKTRGLSFSLSGMENQAEGLCRQGEKPENVAFFVLASIADVVIRVTRQAQAQYGGLPVLCSGGVSSNTLLRAQLTSACGGLFAPPEYSADNAMGVAILAHRLAEGG
ncbi:MAG: DNA-binding protein, partial [Oscillospiraceae bacterium]